VSAVNCPDFAGSAFHAKTTDGNRHVTKGLGLLWNFDARTLRRTLYVKHIMKLSFLFFWSLHSTRVRAESRASLLGVSCLQCTHVMQCDPKGQPDWNYFNSILLWTWCSALPTVIGAAWIFMCVASINGGRRCSVLHLHNCSHCLEKVSELYTFLYCIVYYHCLHLCEH